MPEIKLLEARPETLAETAQRQWFEKQALAAPDNLEAAARLLIGLATTLLGLLFGVLAVAETPIPSYVRLPVVRGLGIGIVLLLVAGLFAALDVILPWRSAASSTSPPSQQAAFERLLRRKSLALSIAVLAFGAAIFFIGVILVIALAAAG
jgi:hypothetical protein